MSAKELIEHLSRFDPDTQLMILDGFNFNSTKMDNELKGVFVKRCKCGAIPYYDRICIFPTLHWIACNCGRTGKSSTDKNECINNWNTDKINYKQ